jgi:hypothetical protein
VRLLSNRLTTLHDGYIYEGYDDEYTGEDNDGDISKDEDEDEDDF